jgi:hypothetical protein
MASDNMVRWGRLRMGASSRGNIAGLVLCRGPLSRTIVPNDAEVQLAAVKPRLTPGAR